MRQLWCTQCAEGSGKEAGMREILAAGDGEPAEYERITYLILATPTAAQRTMKIRQLGAPDESFILASLVCDHCNSPLRAGDRVCAWTVWTSEQVEPEHWEAGYRA